MLWRTGGDRERLRKSLSDVICALPGQRCFEEMETRLTVDHPARFRLTEDLDICPKNSEKPKKDFNFSFAFCTYGR